MYIYKSKKGRARGYTTYTKNHDRKLYTWHRLIAWFRLEMCDFQENVKQETSSACTGKISTSLKTAKSSSGMRPQLDEVSAHKEIAYCTGREMDGVRQNERCSSICYQWLTQRLILSVSEPDVRQRSQIKEDTVKPSVPAREYNLKAYAAIT